MGLTSARWENDEKLVSYSWDWNVIEPPFGQNNHETTSGCKETYKLFRLRVYRWGTWMVHGLVQRIMRG